MNLIGRWERVRRFSTTTGWGQPYLLDRKWKTLNAFKDEEWWQSPSGLWVPTLRGGSVSGSRQTFNRLSIGPSHDLFHQLDGQIGQHALSTNYVAGTGGRAIGVRVMLPEAKTLTDLYFYIAGYGGTAANVNDLDWEVRGAGSNLARPDTTGVIASGTVNPSSATKWVRITGISAALSAATVYWFILGDADGGGDNAVINEVWSASDNADLFAWTFFNTTNGWTSDGTGVAAGSALCVAVYDDGTVQGNPWEIDDISGSVSVTRGLLVDTFEAKIWAIDSAIADSVNYSALNIWEGTDGPGGSPLVQSTAKIGHANSVTVGTGFVFSDFFEPDEATQYRFAFTYGGNSVSPIRRYIGTSADANLRKAMPGGGGWCLTTDSAGSWSDDTDRMPKIGLFVEDSIVGGGGGPPPTSGAPFSRIFTGM